MPRPGCPQDRLVEILPVVLGHQPEGAQEAPAERVEVGVVVVGILPEALEAGVVGGARARAAGVAAQLIVLRLLLLVPVGPVGVESQPRLVVELSPGAVLGEVLDALVSQYAHVNLQAQQGEHRESEHRQYYNITKIFH